MKWVKDIQIGGGIVPHMMELEYKHNIRFTYYYLVEIKEMIARDYGWTGLFYSVSLLRCRRLPYIGPATVAYIIFLSFFMSLFIRSFFLSFFLTSVTFFYSSSHCWATQKSDVVGLLQVASR